MVGDIEDVKHQIALLIASTAFTATLAAVDTEKGNDVVTPAPAQIEENEKVTPTNFPACQLIGLDTEFDQDAGPTLQDCVHRIAVVWLAVGDDEKTVTKYVERLVRATRDTFWGSMLTGTINAGPVQVRHEDYSELVQPDNAFLKGGRTILAVPTLVQ